MKKNSKPRGSSYRRFQMSKSDCQHIEECPYEMNTDSTSEVFITNTSDCIDGCPYSQTNKQHKDERD